MNSTRPVSKVGSIISHPPIAIRITDSLATATAVLQSNGISAALVKEADCIVGLLTEVDIVHATNLGLTNEAQVGEIMDRNLALVSEEDGLDTAYHALIKKESRHLVITNSEREPVGIVSESDFHRHRDLLQFLSTLRVEQAMNLQYIRLPRDASVSLAAAAMEQHQQDCILVLDTGGTPVGIVTSRDIVNLFSRQKSEVQLGEVMTSPVRSISQAVPLSEALASMQSMNLRHMAVTDGDGLLAGILTEHDISKLLRSDFVQMLQKLVLHQAKQFNQDRFRALVDNLPQKILVKDKSSVYLSCNASYARDLGISADSIAGKTDDDFFPADLAHRYRADDRRVMESQTPITIEEPYIQQQKLSWIQTTKAPMIDADGKVSGIVAIFHDITQKKLDADEMRRRTWALEALRSCNRALVFANTETELLQSVCNAITQQGMYVLASFGWAEHDDAKTVRIVATSGSATDYAKNIDISWGDNPLGNGPTGRAIRLGISQVNNQALYQSFFHPWMEAAARYDIQASLALPISINNEVVAALTVYSREPEAFGANEVTLFEELAVNVSFGIQSRRTRTAYEQSLKDQARQAIQMEQSLEEKLLAIALTLEQRDPYTAGHQKHVAELAVRMGLEMRLSDEDLRCIYLSAIVHDLGKIQIPAEILTKPSRLNEAEFNMIKLHPEVGYNILKQIQFPWPIAEVIRQHHEYLDGSGYPRGLKGDEIHLAARIITVADIVESMSSDRPYRPALSLDAAINEIEKMREIRLDPVAVDACIAVLRRGEFTPSRLGH